MASIHWTQGAVKPTRANQEPRQLLIACPYYEIEHVRFNTATALGGLGRLQALIVTNGQGRFANGEFVTAGDAWILPAAMPSMPLHLDMPLAGLLCTLPDAPSPLSRYSGRGVGGEGA